MTTWIDPEGTILSEISQKEKDKYYTISRTWNLKYDTNQCMKQKQTHRYREQTCGYQGGEGVGEGRNGSLGLAEANYYI